MRLTAQRAKSFLPKRSKHSLKKSHKGSFGHLLVCAGSSGAVHSTWGAGILASSSAFRMGLGYVTWASFQKPDKQIRNIPEVLVGKLPEILNSKKFSAFLVGPGLGITNATKKIILKLLKQDKPVLLDADALTVLAKYKIKKLKSNFVLTPHHGEMARLLNLSVKEIEQNRNQSVKMAAKKYGCVVLLKGYPTLVSDGVRIFEIHKGNAALAKAGSGDVLSGMIASLLAQGVESIKAACLGAYLHGDAADRWIQTKDIRSLKASDIIESLPVVLKANA